MGYWQLVRAVSIVAPPGVLAVAVSLSTVGLVAPWWTKALTGGTVAVIEVTAGTQINLWGHLGCSTNETWNDICSLPASACPTSGAPEVIGTAYDPLGAGGWRPGQSTPTPSPPSPTPKPPPQVNSGPYSCLNGGTNCPQPAPTPEPDPNRWGEAQTKPGDGQSFGDSIARVPVEATASAEDPARYPPTTTLPRPTTTVPPPAQNTATKPASLPAEEVEVVSGPDGAMAGLWGTFRSVGTGELQPLPTEPDPLMEPKSKGTEPPPQLPGIGLMLSLCDDDGDYTRACALRSGCAHIYTIRGAIVVAIGFCALYLVVVLPAVLVGLIKVPNLAPIGVLLGIGCSISLGVSLGKAAAVDVPHTLDGPGFGCTVTALSCSILSTLLAGASIYPLIILKISAEEDGDDDEEAGEEFQKKTHPRSTIPVPQLPSLSVVAPAALADAAWATEPTPENPAVADAMMPAGSSAARPQLALPPPEVAPPAPQSQASMRRFLAGEGAVYAYAQKLAQASAAEAEELGCPTCRQILQPYNAYDDGYECSGCERVQAIGASLIGCPTCDYDLCSGCALQARHQRPASADVQSKATDADIVPVGWQARLSKTSGAFYYVNEEAGRSQWNHPSSGSNAFGATAPAAVWKSKKSKRTGQVYSVRQAW